MNYIVMKTLILISFSFLLLILLTVTVQADPLTVHPDNPRYFTDGSGKAIYMTGSHNWGVLTNRNNGFPEVEYIKFLDYMVDNNQNFLRLWAPARVWDPPGGNNEYRTPTIYQRTGPGTATDGRLKFDLTKYDPAYTNNLRSLVEAARHRGIYVSVMLFEGWWNAKPKVRDAAWYGHPYNPLNNINNLTVTTTNVHTLALPRVVSLQKGYIKNIIDAVNHYDNILYEIVNEDKMGSSAWQIHLMNYIKKYESTKPKQHIVWLTSKAWGTNDDWLWRSTAEAVSPSRLSYCRDPNEPYITNPPVTDGSKVVLLDTDHFLGCGDYDWRRFVWKGFFRGYNPIVMDPYLYHKTWVLDPDIVSATGYTRIYGIKMNLAGMTPSDNAGDCSTTYCLRNPGQEYLIYQPHHHSLAVNLVAGDYNYEWFNPELGTISETGTLTADGGNHVFSIPSTMAEDAVLYLKRRSNDTGATIPTTAPNQ
jgi:hypothetical protein